MSVNPTPWCVTMVVVPKASRAVWICVVMNPFNEHVLQEVHIHSYAKSWHNPSKLTSGTIFSKLDVNNGFQRITLATKSRLPLTFTTPYGQFCFTKLWFDICSAPEIFHCQMNDILSGVPGVFYHVDDILVFRTIIAEHDSRLHELK